MAIATITTGVVTSWGGTENSALITGGSAPSEFTLNSGADEFDTTALNGSGVSAMTRAPGMYNVSGSIRTRVEPMRLGTGGFITASGAYLTNLKGWNLNITRPAFPADVQVNGTGTAYREFLPGIYSWGGSWTAFFDATTPVVLPGTAYTAAVFKILEEAAGTDHTLTGNIVTTGMGVPVKVGDLSQVTYNFEGSGALTSAGSGAVTPIFAVGAWPSSAAGALVLQAVTNQTFSLSAFWTRIGLSVPVDGPITVDIDFQGTGALTIG